MPDDLVDAVTGALPHLPGYGGLALAVATFFRVGRSFGRIETRFVQTEKDIANLQASANRAEGEDRGADVDRHESDIAALKTKLAGAEQAATQLALKLAELPRREEVRGMITESRDDTRAILAEVRADIRALKAS